MTRETMSGVRKVQRTAWCVTLFVAALCASPAAISAAIYDYDYVDLLNEQREDVRVGLALWGFGELNNDGLVVFQGEQLIEGLWREAIFLGDGGPLSTLATTNPFLGFGIPSINDSGTTAFLEGSTQTIFSATGGSLTPEVTLSDGPFSRLSYGDIDDAGNLVFNIAPISGPGWDEAIYQKTGGAVIPLLDFKRDPFVLQFIDSPPTVNDQGQVAMAGILGDQSGVFLLDGTTVTPVATIGDHFSSLNPFHQGIGLNNLGQVVFHGQLTTGESGIFLWDHGTPQMLIDDTGGLSDFGGPVINDQGQVMVSALFAPGQRGIFSNLDWSHPVIASGDSLFGESVLFVSDPDLNDKGQFFFDAQLQYGDFFRSTIVRADPLQSSVIPEPSSLLLLGSGLLGLTGFRRRRKP